MERSDEARREDSLYDRLGSVERKNRKLKARIETLEQLLVCYRNA